MSGFWNSIISYVKSHDEIAKPISSRLHMSGTRFTCIGGTVSMLISMYLLYTIFNRTYDMVTYFSPDTTTKFQGLEGKT